MIKKVVKKLLNKLGYSCSKIKGRRKNEVTILKPWDFASFERKCKKFKNKTLISTDRLFILEKLLIQSLRLDGDVVECGVYKGGTAAWFNNIMNKQNSKKKLFLFDTFSGMPFTDSKKDLHKKGDFADTSLSSVQKYLNSPRCIYFPGLIPTTFKRFNKNKICFCHIDLDIYRPILASLDFFWPRLTCGGIFVFDDYGFSTCPGAREAVDKFFKRKRSAPIYIPTGQAIVFKI